MKEVKPPRKPLFYYYGIALVVLLLINFLLVPLVARHAVQEVDYGTFMTMTENKEIGKVEVEDNQIIFTNKDGSKIYKTGPMNDPDLTQRLYDAGAEFTRDIVEQTSPLLSVVLTWVLPIVLFIAVGQLMAKKLTDRAGGPGSMMFGAGKSNAKIYVQSSQGIRFADVAGEDEAKENLQEIVNYLHDPGKYQEIGASMPKGILLVGPPGSGKSMLSKRLPSILPDMTRQEQLDVTQIYSVMGLLRPDHPLIESRPFRSPHHTVSAAALAGGGANVRPGEISLAHKGVLFLDELPEFRRDAIESMRQPLEDGRVTISRVAGQVTYPARFQLIAAMNPCKCGWYGTERCTCTKAAVQQYLHRLSGPLLDRIDLQVAVQPVEYAALAARGQASEEHSADIRARVLAARERQYTRQGADVCNAAIPPPQLAEHCPLSADASRMFAAAFQRLGLTARAHDRLLRVARTIADLADSSVIEAEHLAEALQYRSLDRAAGS